VIIIYPFIHPGGGPVNHFCVRNLGAHSCVAREHVLADQRIVAHRIIAVYIHDFPVLAALDHPVTLVVIRVGRECRCLVSPEQPVLVVPVEVPGHGACSRTAAPVVGLGRGRHAFHVPVQVVGKRLVPRPGNRSKPFCASCAASTFEHPVQHVRPVRLRLLTLPAMCRRCRLRTRDRR